MDHEKLADEYIRKEIEVLQSLDRKSIAKALDKLTEAWENERDIYIFGNGGSSATASHFENDFNKGVSEPLEKKFRFHCLNDNMSTVMAVANDLGFEEVFRFQLVNRVKKDDIIMAISGSGNSKNVLNAVEYAKERGAYIIGITGYNGGKLMGLSDLNLHADINSMQITEDIHMMFDHLMMSVLYKTLCGKDHMQA
ncbi:MAG: SIS domain-containing protein [Lachnospiraceae bacterium]|nr:SIS domain-containing protein [Lachnospiraceae bacterium]